MGVMNFYKYIQKRKNGSYIIEKCGEKYGTYSDIRDALHDRDILIDCEWDVTEMNARDEIPNKYYDMELPPSRRYITLKRQDKREYYMIRKTINGKQEWFGQFKTFLEAVERRDELVANNWEV